MKALSVVRRPSAWVPAASCYRTTLPISSPSNLAPWNGSIPDVSTSGLAARRALTRSRYGRCGAGAASLSCPSQPRSAHHCRSRCGNQRAAVDTGVK